LPVAGDVALPMIAGRDIAERASEVLTRPAPGRPAVVSLLGPRDYSLDECAAIIGRAVGKPVRHVQVTPEQARQSFLAMGATQGFTDAMLELYAGFQAGRVVPESPRSAASTTPTTFETFAEEVLVPVLSA
jgi:uncharacterized protein YbjT (DUF2867 family)